MKNRSRPVSIVLVGIGGMGSVYVSTLLENLNQGVFQIQGAVDPFPQKCPHLRELKLLKVPIYSTLEEFYGSRSAELAIVSSPIQFHCQQTCLALQNKSDVLCEKPIAATIQEARTVIRAAQVAEKWVAIGYQWSFSSAIQTLKRDIAAGLFGKPRRMRCLYLWPRDEAYYSRNDWAGKQKDAEGRWILDSPANNAMAHDLHNMFYILGKTRESSGMPVRVRAELYRAHRIQNFDSAAARVDTDRGAEILFFVSHVSEADKGPILFYEFEEATVSCRGRNSSLIALWRDGSVRDYGNPDAEPMNKLWNSIESVRTRRPPACGPEAAVAQTLCLNGIHESSPEIANFPKRMIRTQGEPGRKRIWVRGLDAGFEKCFQSYRLPSELGISWSRPGKIIDLKGYKDFPAHRDD